jgi:hypothetical protein
MSLQPFWNLVPLLPFFLVACAHSAPPPPRERVMWWVDTSPPPPPPPPPPPGVLEEFEEPRPPQRLTRTVTLGQGDNPAYTDPSAPGRTSEVSAPRTTPSYGGTYYRGYYRGYGYGYGVGTTRTTTVAPSGTTPRAGGNWPAPPSYGPPAMK